MSNLIILEWLLRKWTSDLLKTQSEIRMWPLSRDHLKSIDLDRSPAEGAPALAVEVVSPSNRAEDMVKKTRQYLEAGCRSVWIVYPALRLVEVHSARGVRTVQEPESLKDEGLLPGFTLSLTSIFDITN